MLSVVLDEAGPMAKSYRPRSRASPGHMPFTLHERGESPND